jgi:hypothetical protein
VAWEKDGHHVMFQLVYEHRFVVRNIICQLLEFKSMYLIVSCDTPLMHAYDNSHANDNMIKQGVCHTMALPFALKSILRQKKNYENSNISPCENKIFKKSSKRNQNPSRYYNSITNLKFQHKPKYHLTKILI